MRFSMINWKWSLQIEFYTVFIIMEAVYMISVAGAVGW